MRIIVAVSLAVALSACASHREVEFRPAPNALGPFSEAVKVDDILFLSGMIGTDASGRLVAGGIQAEARQTMENIRTALERNKLALTDVVKCTVMLADIAEWSAFNE